MSLFGKTLRIDVIALIAIGAIAGPILALKAPGILGLIGSLSMIALIVLILNMCVMPLAGNLVLGATTLAAFGNAARLSATLIFAPASLLSLNGILLILVTGMWTHFALQTSGQIGSWKDNRKIGGPRR